LQEHTFMNKLALSLGLAALTSAASIADTLWTTDGKKIEGKVRLDGDEYVLEGKLGSTRIHKNRVSKVEYGKTTRETYEEKAAALKADDVKGHWALALWCKNEGLGAEYRKEAQAVVAADPAHEEAHLALGHKLVGGTWMSNEDIHLANGEVQRDGKWVTADEGDRLDAEEKARDLLRKSGSMRDKDAEKHAALVDELVKIRPDALLAPCSRSVSSTSRLTRLAAWRGIGAAFADTRRRFAFVQDLQAKFDKLGDLTGLALREKDDDVRKIAIDATKEFGEDYARAWYQNRVVQEEGPAGLRAAEVLAEINNPASVPYLMTAFYSVYIEVRATNAQAIQDITDSFVDFIADPTRRAITTPLRIETPKLGVQRVKSTAIVPEGWHSTAATAYGSALGAMTGKDYGDDFEDWYGWFKDDGKKWVKEQIRAREEAAGAK
jgi:hypothetical protein